MKTIAQTYIDQGLEQGLELGRKQARQEMQEEIKKVRQEAQAEKRLGLLSSIELGLELKFGKEGLRFFNEVEQIQETKLLSSIRAALKFVSDLSELRSIYQPALASN